MFCDSTEITIGSERVIVTRMTRDELIMHREIFAQGKECLDDRFSKLIATHCKMADGKPVPVGELSLPQLIKLCKEIAGVPEGSPLSDFIGLVL